MHQQRQSSPCDSGQRRSQLLLRDHGETVDAGMDQKTFEPRHACGCESFNVALIIVNNSAPSRPIDAAFAACSRTLGLQSGNSSRRRQAVQRHIHQQRVTARSRCSCRGFEAFPFRAPRIVDVHVRIDQPGKNGRIAKVVPVEILGYLIVRDNRPGSALPPQDGRRPDSSGVTTRRARKPAASKYSPSRILETHTSKARSKEHFTNSRLQLILPSQRSGCERVHVDEFRGFADCWRGA